MSTHMLISSVLPIELMTYCAHDLRARPSERVGEDGRAGIEPAVIAQMERIEHLS